MKTIKIWADTHSTGIIDEMGSYLFHDETTISNDTWNELQIWVRDYDYIIPLNVDKRKKHKKEIENLDQRGINLLFKIKSEWNIDIETNEPIIFEYFSEGLLKKLDI